MALPLPQIVSNVGPGGRFVDSMQATNALIGSMLGNQGQAIKNQYYAPNIQSEIAERNALTQGQNIRNQQLPEQLRLANVFSALRNQYYGPNMQSEISNRNAMTGAIPSEIAERDALTNKMNTMTPLEAINQKNVNDWYAQKAQSDIAANKSLADFRSMGGGGKGGVGVQNITALQRQLMMEGMDKETANRAASAYISGEGALPNGKPLPPISGISQALVDQIIKQGTTAQGLNQQRFAATTDEMLNKGSELLPSVTKYSGALGRAKGNLDAVANSLGAGSQDYNDYIYFTRTFVPSSAAEMMRASGANASDEQKKLYQKIINPISWDQDPKAASENYKRMQDLFNTTTSKVAGKSTGQIRSDLRKAVNNDPLGIR